MAYLLEQWDAIELFCRIIAKKEGISLGDFKNNSLLIHELNKYSNQERAERLSNEIIQHYIDRLHKKKKKGHEDGKSEKIVEKGKDKIKGSVRLIYHLSKDIRDSMPVRIEDFPFNACLDYIGSKKFKEEKRVHLGTFIPSLKQRQLEGTKWWLYFYDEWNKIENGKMIFYKGVSRGILHLYSFGKAEFIRHNTGTSEKRIYSGTFEMFGDEKYLSFRMKLKKSPKRDLRMLFYIGSDEYIEIALGLAGNVSESFWSRTVMIQPIEKEIDQKPVAGFFSEKLPNKNNSEIHDHVWKYFEERELSMLRVPTTVTSIETFYEWKTRTGPPSGGNLDENENRDNN